MPGALLRTLACQRLTILGAFFVVAGTVVAYGDTGYPFLSAAFAALLAVSLGGALVLAAPFAYWKAGRIVFFAIGFTYFLDVAYIGGGPRSGALIVILAGYLAYLIAWRKDEKIVPFATTAVAISTLLILPQQLITSARNAPSTIELAKAGPTADKRPYVHIILDEMSPLSMMPHGPFYDDLRERMVSDYRQRGFDVFQNTIAAAGRTIGSLGQVFADHDGELHNYKEIDGAFTYALGENRVTDMLADAGYAVTMLQSSYLELCDPARAHCLTYAHSGDGSALAARAKAPLATVDYALRTTGLRLLIQDTSRASVYYRILGRIAEYTGFALPSWQRDFARPPLVVSTMEKAAPALRRLGKGDAVIMHFLLPHYPYVLDENCRVKPPEQVRVPRWVTPYIGATFDQATAERAYWEQAACAHDRLMAIIDAILSSPGGKDAVIVVHGDHGSRLFKLMPDNASETERRYTLLAHFAVRGLSERHDELSAHHRLRDRVSIVMNAVLGSHSPDADLVTSSTD